MGNEMKRAVVIFCVFLMMACMPACSIKKLNTEKLNDLSFEVVTRDIPEELAGMIEAHKGEPFKLSYADQGILYIAEGYGRCETSGYSIEVKECFETSNAIYFRTDLIGPSKEEAIVKEETFPYIVIQTKYIGKNVVFM